jgi:glycosyltransferase involved in cell wall biosynthesis
MNKASLVILSYNQEKYIRDALDSCLNQKGKPIQIIISDDCSSDGTYPIIKDLVSRYKGKHEVVLSKNTTNLGLIGNFNSALSLARGSSVVVAAGDDISLQGRVIRSLRIINRDNRTMCVSMGLQSINDHGKRINPKIDLLEKLSTFAPATPYKIKDLLANKLKGLSGASRCFRRSVWEYFGPICETCPTEDSTTLLRCLILGVGYAVPTIGVKYRIHDSNISSENGLRRMDLNEIHKQYISDISRARSGGFINAIEEKSLFEWALLNMESRLSNLYSQSCLTSQESTIAELLSPSTLTVLRASRKGQRSIAKKILTQKIQEKAADSDAMLALVVCYIEEGNIQQALENIERMEEYKAPNKHIYYAKELVRVMTGKAE